MEDGKKRKWNRESRETERSQRETVCSKEERKQPKMRKMNGEGKKATTNDHTIMNLHRFSSISTHYILMQWILCVFEQHTTMLILHHVTDVTESSSKHPLNLGMHFAILQLVFFRLFNAARQRCNRTMVLKMENLNSVITY